MANIFEDISNKLKSLSSNNPSGYDKKYVEGLTSIVKAENKPTESAIKGVPTTSVTKSNNSTKAKNSTVKTYNDFGNDADYERYLVENNISKTKGEALSYLNSKAKENGTTARQYSIDMTNRVKNTLNTEKLEKNQNTLTDAQKEAVNQFGVIVDSKGNEVDSNTYNNNINLYNETATNINNQITELNNAYTNGQIDYNTMQTKYNELQNKWNENQLVGEDLSNYKTLTGFDYYNWAKENGKDVTEFEKYAESIDDSWLENLTEVYAASLADAINTPVQAYEILKNIVTGEDFTDENSYSSKLNNASAELRQYAYAGTSGVKKWSTQVVDSLLPMAHATISAIAIGSATGLTAGMDKIASTKVANKISLGILGTQTAGQVTRQRIQEGNDLTSAVLNGTLHGAITGLVESIGGEGVTSLFTGSAEQYLFANALFQKANPLNIAKYINAVGMAEGAEEVIETIADAFADNVQNWITGFFDGTALKKVNATEIDPSEMFNSFVMGYAGAVILGTPTAFNVSLNSKGKYNVSEQVKQYFKSTLNSDIASVQEKDLAYKCIELINEAQGNSSYKMNSQVSDAITLNTDYSPTTYTYEDVMNNLVNAVQSDVQGELKTATETLSKAKELGTLFQKSLNERGININSQEYMNLSTEAKNTVTSVTKYAQDLDREVVWKEIEDRNGNAVDGIYSKSLGKIILNPNGKQEVLSTLVHEYTHSVEKSTKYFGQLKNLVEQYLGKEKFELAKNRILKDYADITDIDEAGAEAEVVAFTLQKELGKEDFVNRLIKYNGSLAVRIYEDIKHAIGYDSNLKEIEYLFKKAFTDNNTKLYEAKIKETTSDVAFSIAENDRLIDDQKAELTQMAEDGIIQDRIEKGIYPKNFIKNYEKSVEVMNAMRDIMAENLDILPDDKIGETLFSNGSYDVSTENTTDCVRTLGYKKLLSLIEDKVNRPLSYMESMLVSQKLYEIAVDPQCLYCYVSLDRKGFDDALLKYFNNRNKLFQRYEEMGRPEIDYSSETIENQKEKEKARKNNNPLFKEFLKGNRGENRKATDVMWNRFTTFIENYKNGATLLSQEDVRNEDARKELLNLPEDSDLRKQYLDAHKYAQSASWAKISHGYRAYGGDILALNQETVDALNSHYGMRWYSFSDYTAAFILENMQQITDASIKGLKGLAYTKDTDFVKIFAPTGMGINISVFVDEVDGQFVVDPKQSANLLEAIELRKKFDNVGIVVVATNDNAVKWALNQEWSDVVIPFHIVKGGNEIAQQYGWDNYKNKQSDKVKDKYKWQDYLREYADNIGKNVDELKGVPKMVMPHEHHNDINEYLRICQERGLKPRFDMFLSEPNYMKLVNETRQSDLETSVLQPNFDLDEAKKSFEKFKAKGGYYNGWYNDGVDLDTEAQIVANDISEIKKGNTTFENVPYANQKGRAFKDLLNAQKERWGSTQHGQDIGALRYSNGTDIDTLTQPSNETDASGNTLSVGMADYLSNSIGDRVDPSDINSPHMEWEHGSPNATYTEFDNSKEKIRDESNYVNTSKAIYLTSSHDVASTYSGTDTVVDPNNIPKIDTVENIKQYVNQLGGDIVKIGDFYYITDIGNRSVANMLSNKGGFDGYWDLQDAGDLIARDKNGNYYDDIYALDNPNDYETVSALTMGMTEDQVVEFAKEHFNLAGNYKLYAKSERPFIIDAKGRQWNQIDTPTEMAKSDRYNDFIVSTRDIENWFYENLYGNGYDSIRINNVIDNGRRNGKSGTSDILIVFNSNQVKSVSNLTPTTNSDIRFSKGLSIDELTEIRDRNQQELDRQNKLEEQARTMDQLIENDLWGDAEAVRKGLLNIRNEAGVRSDKATMDTLRAAEKAADESVKHIENATDKELRELAEQVSAMNVSEEALKGLQEFATNTKTTEVLSEPYKKETNSNTLKTSLYNLRQKIVDKGEAIRKIARKNKNDTLQAFYDHYLSSNNIANSILINGINTDTINKDNSINEGKKVKGLRELSSMIPEDQKNDFDTYMYHYLNTDTAKVGKNVFNGVSAEESWGYVQNMEKIHPEWLKVAQGYWDNTEALLNYMVEHERFSENDAKMLRELYPHYVPIVRAMLEDTEVVETDTKGNKFVSTNAGAIKERTGGSQPLQPLDYAMEDYTRRVVKSSLLNDFAKEYVVQGDNVVPVLFTEMFDGADRLGNLDYDAVMSAQDNQPATMVWYDKGEKKIMQIPQGIYDALDYKQTPFSLPDSKVLTKLNQFRRNLITGKNPLFMITNPIKDAQEIIYNSKHALATYGKLPKAFWELCTNGEVARFFKENGGEYMSLTSEGIKDNSSKFYKNTVGRIEQANNIMELTPRLAEFMASIEKGRTKEQALYDAAEVTCNFKRGGDYAKWADRNGATFLNASIQGMDKQVRMIQDAYDQKGWKGVLSHMAKATLLYSLPLMVINALRWKDDEDYEQLSDYIKDNYYILFKYGDGKFFRIPKGRVAAAYQGVLDTLYENGVELASDDSLKEKAVYLWENSLDGIKSAYDNIGVNNPLSNNIFAPAIQTLNNETWYGDPIVSEYMAKKDNAEQYDYSTDKFSVWLGKQLDLSPKKINYLLDQYSGAIGDVLLPVFTPKAETGLSDGSVVGNVAGALVSPLADKFTTDSVFKNQDVTDFYTMVDELYTRSTKENASDEEKLAYKYMNSIKSQMNKLYTERNDIYNSDLNDKDKYAQAKEVQKQVVELAQSGLATYDQIDKYENYAEIGGIGFTKDEEGNWTKANTETVDFINDLDVDNKVELKQRVLGATGITENGKTVRNSKALEVADAYADMGVLDDVFAYIEANGIDPTEVGLNKTVASKSYEQIKSSYEDVYGEVFGNGDYQPTTSQTSKTSTNTTTKTKKAVNAYFNALKGSGSDIYSGLNIKTTKVSDVNKKVDEILKNL